MFVGLQSVGRNEEDREREEKSCERNEEIRWERKYCMPAWVAADDFPLSDCVWKIMDEMRANEMEFTFDAVVVVVECAEAVARTWYGLWISCCLLKIACLSSLYV